MDMDTWTFTSLNIPRHEIAKRNIIPWCEQNIGAHWTVFAENRFGFEDAGDAINFKIQFGFGS